MWITATTPLNRDYNWDPNIQTLKKEGFMNHVSTLCILCGPNPTPSGCGIKACLLLSKKEQPPGPTGASSLIC